MLATLLAATGAWAADGHVRGVVKAVRQASFSTDVPMRIARLPFREGERFKAGDLLVEFDCRRQAADLEAMRGAVREAELNVASSDYLNKFNAIGRHDIEVARARLEKASGELKGLKARVDDCRVVAPFVGRVAEAPLRELEFTVAQRPYLAIVGEGQHEIDIIVSSSTIADIQIGQTFSFRLDELPHATVSAVVSAVGAVVDPVSKTGKIVGVVTSAPAQMTTGMSGTANFAPNPPLGSAPAR